MNIVFDLGKVLLDWQPEALVARLLPRRAADAAAAAALVVDVFEGFGGDWGEFDRGAITPARLADLIAARTGLRVDQARAVIDAVPGELRPMAGMTAVLACLRRAGHALYFLSNMPRPYADHLEATHDFLKQFEGGVFSGRVGLIKPEPAIFRHAVQTFGLDPAQTVFIDDVQANVAAARAEGWRAFQFQDAFQCAAELTRIGVTTTREDEEQSTMEPANTVAGADTELTLFHTPNTRSSGALLLLEELRAPYKLQLLNMKAGEQRGTEYLAINPMGKVPSIRHRGEVVTEQAAIYTYLADEFPQQGLAPAIGDPLRGPYLRWMAFYGSCFEPALIDKSQKREPAPPAMSPYGDYDTMFKTLVDQLGRGPYLLGERFFAVDLLWGTALGWMTMFKLVPELPVIGAYVERINARPAVQAARQKDAELAKTWD